MKKLFILTLLGTPFITSCVHAQEVSQQNVPSVIINSFSKSYPNANDVEWEKHGQIYEVEFEIKNKDHHVWYNAEGKVQKHKTEIQFSELPTSVNEVLKKDFTSFKIDDINLIEENDNSFYQIELDSDSVDRKVHISVDGKVLSNYIDY